MDAIIPMWWSDIPELEVLCLDCYYLVLQDIVGGQVVWWILVPG